MLDQFPVTIMKFGGSCFVNSAAFKKIEDITNLYASDKKIYVASALNGITNKLIDVAEKANKHDADGTLKVIKDIEKKHTDTIREIFGHNHEMFKEAEGYVREKITEISTVCEDIEEFGLEPYFLDFIMSFGEKLSTYLLYLFLKMQGFSAQFFTGEELIITNDDYGDALPDFKFTYRRIENAIKPVIESPADDTIFCVTGFIGRNKIGFTTTLGRGGSDFTATILARAVYDICKTQNVKVILWKDVDGILTANPKYVKEPALVYKLNYAEAKEMAFFGAKILHPKCLAAIEKQNIKVEIRNFDKPKESINYSIISNESATCDLKGISSIDNAAMITVASGTLVNVPGVLGKIFTIMGDNGINVSMVAQSSSEVNTTFVVEKEDGKKATEILKNHPQLQDWFNVEMQEVAILAVIGDQVHKSKNKSRVFSALAKINLEAMAVAQSSDGLNISIVVPHGRIQEASNAINEEFRSC
jgi:aspartate kinase